MATPLDLPFPEITIEEFHQAWTRFELVADAKEWNADRRKLVLPILPRGKLVEFLCGSELCYLWGPGELEDLPDVESRAGARPFNIKPTVHVALSTSRRKDFRLCCGP